ncbi:MAG: DUF2806 domain-containing protein [Pseudomonadota bacterium]
MSEQADRRTRLVDKVWQTLFGGGDSALLAPWRMRQREQDRTRVRDAELKAVNTMLDELDGLHAGRKVFNRAGEIVDAGDTRSISRIRLNSIIEVQEEDPAAALEIPDTAEALHKIRLEADINALRRSLNVRRIGLRAETIAEALEFTTLSERPVDPDWLLRWQEAAARVVATDFQDLWARMLVDEVRQPGSHSLRTLGWLATLSRADVETIRFVARLDLGGFICREAAGYFKDDIHAPMFVQLAEMGLVEDRDDARVTLRTTAGSGLKVVLRCHARTLVVEGVGEELALAAYPFTRLGREIFPLFAGSADSAYLFAIGNGLKKRGFRVEMVAG